VILAPNWAEHAIDGQYSGESYGYTPSDANYFLQRYIDLLENYLGLRTIRLTDTRSDANHQWGLAPFHYAEPVYAYLMEKLKEFAPRRTAPTASPPSQGAPQVGSPPALESVRPRTSSQPSVVLVHTAGADESLTSYLESVATHGTTSSVGILRAVARDSRRLGSGSAAAVAEIGRIDGVDAPRIFVSVGDATSVAAELAKADGAAPVVCLYPSGLESFDPGITPVHVFMAPAHFRAHYPADTVDKALAAVALLTKSGSIHSMHDPGALTRKAVQQIMDLVGDMTEVRA
jgi:hypothetical protein